MGGEGKNFRPLAEGYIERYSQPVSLDDNGTLKFEDKNFWAYEQVCDLVNHDPDKAFDFVLYVMSLTEHENVLANLAAGPLEDLIRVHGKTLINKVESNARESQKFKELLGMIYKVGDDDIWVRIEAILLSRP